MADKPLDGKVALITGAGSSMGMGREMALALAEAGARVALMDINAEQLERNVNDAREVGGDGSALPIVGSVHSWDDAQRAVSETISGLGGLHVLVNNAGIPSRRLAGFWELPPEEWVQTISVNASGPFIMARAAIGHLREQGWGRIVGVTTSLDTMIRNLPYGPSKSAHESFVAIIAKQLEGSGVTANVLIPGGATNTNFISNVDVRDRDALIQPVVMRAPIAWLASDEADGINGRRIIASKWDENLPIEQRLEVAAAPAAWPQLGRPPEEQGP
ncbi:MAG: SDR family NAD(P)-dependent oxidoreductase [Chloroflexota bacterium]|nr:SDR family NAD(P)-dependent oxidoreductase [Chloroflexota bacterium]MDE2884182.1 SDR family NAD(P)-dependent oxidoreductase [Chloroflexota bacterium]